MKFLIIVLTMALSLAAQARTWAGISAGLKSDDDLHVTAPRLLMIIRPDADSIHYAIRPDADTTGISTDEVDFWPWESSADSILQTAQPSDNNLLNLRRWMPTEVRGTANLTRGYYDKEGMTAEMNAGLELTALWQIDDNWYAGITTGLYHGVGRYATRYIPICATAEYRLQPLWMFTPFAEVYAGALIGIDQGTGTTAQGGTGTKHTDWPNCATVGLRMGAYYPIGSHLRLRAALHLQHLTDSPNDHYPKTGETGFGVSGSICWRL
ncbi:MAG: hypothetical protein K6E86_07515 [Bacteroidales bacterium]|nr:hypothetical protein [Bacteroidales bacterium]